MPKVKKSKAVESELLKAIRFVSFAQSKTGTEMATFCRLVPHAAIAFNGMLAAGHVTDLEIEACPQTELLRLALLNVSSSCAFVLQENTLGLRSGDFQAHIPCCDPSRLPQANPDAAIMEIGDGLVRSLAYALPVASEKAEYLLNSAVHMQNGTVMATDNAILVQSWHGYNLPPMTLPRSAANAIVKCGLSLTAFGYSGDTATFWFGDNAWIKTRLFKEECKDLNPTINRSVDLQQIPKGYFQAIKQVAPFSEDGRILIAGSIVSSHVKHDAGGKIEKLNADLPPRIYHFKALKYVASFAETMDTESHERVTFFYGKDVRAVIAHSEPIQQAAYVRDTEVTNDDIPF